LEIAQKYGLGDTVDVLFNFVVELFADPISKIVVKYYGLVIDSFLGFEQFTQIKPPLVAQIIEQAIDNGWTPNQKGDYKVELFENSGQKHRPAVLVLPGFNADTNDYENIIKPIQTI